MIKSDRPFWGWTIAIAGSVLLNVSLFGLMPGLIQRLPDRMENRNNIQQLQVIRVKKTAPPPPRKNTKKIEKPLPLKNMTNSRNTDIMPRPATLNPYRAFEMNPKLPAASMDLVMPDLEKFSMDLPVLKNQYAMGELDSPLIPLVKIPPIYPVRASRRGIEGFVTVEFIVTQKGLVQEIKIIEAEPETIFNKSVIQCVSKWKFLPGTVQGMPVATQAITTIRFELEQ